MITSKHRKKLATISDADLETQRRERIAEEAREALERKKSRRRKIIRRTLGWTISMLILTALSFLSFVGYENGERRREQIRQEIENTEFSHELTSTDPLLQRVDGSYYRVTVTKFGDEEYEYTTLDGDGAVIAGNVSTSMPDGQRLWVQLHRPIDVSVKIIDPAGDLQEPRIEFESCAAFPIDASEPSFTDDVHGYDPRGADFIDDQRSRLCVDRVTLWVPEGTLQP